METRSEPPRDSPAPSPSPAERRALRVGLLLALGALVLRLADASLASYHLDDFHSLYHARAASVGALLSRLAQDNHPPLSFLVLHALRAMAGESPLVLRLPAVLYGTATVWLTWRLARRLPGPPVSFPRVAATLLVALSSLHLDLSSDLRMYALLATAVLGVLDALVDILEGERGALRLGIWTAVALLTHYHAIHALFVLGLGVGALVLLRRVPRRRLRPVAGGLLLGLLLAAPWYATGFRAQLAHDLPPGGSHVDLRVAVESYAHLLYVRRELLGAFGRLYLVLGPLALLSALAGAYRLLRARGASAFPLLVLAAGLLLPAWSALAARLVPRAGFEPRYLAGAIAPFALLVGAAAGPGRLARLRGVAVASCVAGAGILAAAHVVDPGREDYAGAARFVLAEAGPEDGVLAVEWQPRLFPHGGGWHTYRQLLAGPGGGSRELDHTDDFRLAPGTDLARYSRVFCILRSVPDDVPLLATLRRAFPHEAKRRFGEGVWVLTFSR